MARSGLLARVYWIVLVLSLTLSACSEKHRRLDLGNPDFLEGIHRPFAWISSSSPYANPQVRWDESDVNKN